MVKGNTRQVVVVKGADPKVFEQAIFLVREDVLAEGGISEKTLLQEANRACAQGGRQKKQLPGFLWAAAGAAVTGLVWLLTALLA